MSIEVRKSERENSQNLIRRFTRKVQLSGLLIHARKNRFFKRNKSQELKKRAALRREEAKKKYERLKKLGLLKSNGFKKKN